MGEGGGFPRIRAVVNQMCPRSPVVHPNTKRCRMSSNQLVLVLDAGPCNNIIVSLSSLIPGLLACPSYPSLVLEVGSGPQVLTFRNSTYLDPQAGLIRNLGARQ